MSLLVLSLLALLTFKHFLADYPLQTAYMLRKSSDEWILPLSLHCIVHVTLTFAILCLYTDLRVVIAMCIFEFIVHFIMDAVKARPNLLGRYEPNESAFWVSLGLDQMVHYLTYLIIVWWVT